jgi:hypothetical protein
MTVMATRSENQRVLQNSVASETKKTSKTLFSLQTNVSTWTTAAAMTKFLVKMSGKMDEKVVENGDEDDESGDDRWGKDNGDVGDGTYSRNIKKPE